MLYCFWPSCVSQRGREGRYSLVYVGLDQGCLTSCRAWDCCYLLDLNGLRLHPLCYERVLKRFREGRFAKTVPNPTEQHVKPTRFLDNLPAAYWQGIHERVKGMGMDRH